MLLPSITPLQKGLALKETSEAQVWLSMSEGLCHTSAVLSNAAREVVWVDHGSI